MMIGIVRGREPLIRLMIRGFQGRQQELEALVDTGYTGWLALPPDVIAALNLR
jgi:predicted aspartyl protease